MKRCIRYKPNWYNKVQKSWFVSSKEKEQIRKEWRLIVKSNIKTISPIDSFYDLENYVMWVSSLNQYKFWSNIKDKSNKKFDVSFFITIIILLVNIFSVGMCIYGIIQILIK